ncbi:tripartite tricarboxylate transporter substrate binding protein [Alicycliphilus denitrificans]|uniref:Tripartite tricarboxylate transporter substrate binding protein n=1 Tax=Alicycliphilus denitrificans TaxID=179636 RepID=A0A3R7FEL4_9BURK|nr:tripartite tricarboxylate transporter substrate binding protein [Alicycliphilus denitrificans]RKJ96405.1 tripartite tricarboxylate transporter substrate binding protein [Alicycliphilus denitrificans]
MIPKSIMSLLLAAGVGATALPAHAQEPYPAKPIRMVLGFAAGGGTDVITRALAEQMGAILGQPVIVDNKPGANGNIAAEIVARAPADGYTLLYNTSSIAISPGLYPKLAYNVTKDLAPVSFTANLPIVLVAAKNLNITSVQDFVAHLKKHPGQMNYASAGNGNITHLSALLFLQATGTTANHIPYRSEAPAMTDLAGGQVSFYLGTSPGVIPLMKDGRVQGLATASLKRMPAVPGLPTLSETVAKDLELGAWSGIMAPAGTRPEIIQKLNAAVGAALQDKALLDKFAVQAAEPRHGTPAQYGAFIQSELLRWSQIIKANNVRID